LANDTHDTPKKGKFIAELKKTGNVSKAAELAKVARKTVYRWKDDDTKFADAWKAAIDEAADSLEEEARRRAVEGVKKPIYQGGKRIGYVQEYSDTLLIFLLKGAKPDKYRERYENNQNSFEYSAADIEALNEYESERILAGDDPRAVFAASRKRILREKAKADSA
jgi:hypothetical protein